MNSLGTMPGRLAWLLPLLLTAAAGCPQLTNQDTPAMELACVEPQTQAKYYLYVPSQLDPTRPAPLCVTLHGTHGFDSAKAQAKEWKDLAERHGFIVLAPDLVSPQGLLPIGRELRLRDLERDERNTLAAIREVKRRYNIDEQAVLITGFSAGGYPMYFMGVRNPDVFSVMAGRSANCDVETLKSLPVSPKLQKMPILIMFGKTGINPVNSNLNPIVAESWEALRHLRLNGCKQAELEAVEGGHYRRPEQAFRFWRKHQKQLQTRPE